MIIKRIPKISIVILNYRGKKETIDCLQSLYYINRKGFKLKIILVDNKSDESIEETIDHFRKQTREDPKTRDIDLKLIQNKDNLGFCGGNNVGIQEAIKAKSSFVFILNNDTVVDRDIIVNLLKTSKKYKWEIIGPKIYFYPGNEFHFDRYKANERGKVVWYAGGKIDWNNILFFHNGVDLVDLGQFNHHEETDFVTGCALFIKSEVLKKIGYFNHDYFLYLEDADLCQRAKIAGYKIGFAPKAVLWHKNAASSGKPGSNLHVYYQTRNRLVFGMKYAKLRTKIALIKESLKMLFNSKMQRRGVLDFYLKRFGRGSL
jgi:GT2 family glycosyltransferase